MVKNLGCVFPGQGSQSVGMLDRLAQAYPEILDTFTCASMSLGLDLWQLATLGPEEKLNQTIYTQTVMLTADVAVFRLLRRLGLPLPGFMAGHSLGEYAALVCAGALTLVDSVKLVEHRARLMQSSAAKVPGAMAALIGLSDDDVVAVCKKITQEYDTVTIANYNAIGQTVIAGGLEAIDRAISYAYEIGAKLAKKLPVSVACHCSLLQQAANEFAEYLAQTPFHSPQTNVISNVDLTRYQTASQMRHLLQAHLIKPVRWVETIDLFKSNGCELIIECGPGRILTGLIKRIDKSLSVKPSLDKDAIDDIFGRHL